MHIDPKDVFEHPEQHWRFLTSKSDDEFEGQFFDRKEAGQPGHDGAVNSASLHRLMDQVTECISAFANKNVEGGLLVIGISKTGDVRGVDHLNEEQQNRLTNTRALLRNNASQVKLYDCTDTSGGQRHICLMYVPYCPNGLCETPGYSPKAWTRNGKQNILLDQIHREQILRDKKIVSFETTYCCPYDPSLLDQGVLGEFKRASGEGYTGPDELFLYQIGALQKVGTTFTFTNAGCLFFAANPQRILPHAYIRLLRFAGSSQNRTNRGMPTFERNFSGPLTKQIRELRTFFKESGFFKTYTRRNPTGGFIDEPEFPYLAVDESIVNGVAHRDYAVGLPIECESYPDAFLVTNPGVVLQRNHVVPEHFSLADTILDSTPRNSLLIEWLKRMRDEHGRAFVLALSEGTRRMRDEMAKLDLPAPDYLITAGHTCVKLFNRAAEREAALKAESATPSTEFANLFPIALVGQDKQTVDQDALAYKTNEFLLTLKDGLLGKDWFIDSIRFGRLTAHRRGANLPIQSDVSEFLRFFPAYTFQFHRVFGRHYLSIDYTLEVKNIRRLHSLLGEFAAEQFICMGTTANDNGWHYGKILALDGEAARLFFPEFNREARVATDQIVPHLPKRLLQRLLENHRVTFDLHKAIKQHSLALDPNAARVRSDKTLAIAKVIADSVFPLTIGRTQLVLTPEPVALTHEPNRTDTFRVSTLSEPTVEFSQHQESANIREGITKYGAYQSSPKEIEIIPICTTPMRDKMAVLIQRLKAGQFKYRGGERTFATKFTYPTITTVPSSDHIVDECKRLLDEHPAWGGDNTLSRIFLIHTPENEYALDDEKSPYYKSKRFLFEKGVPCQMVDTPTLHNPDWKDLNLALNVVAKCGVTPWVLPGAIPDADFFIGLSYTQCGHGSVQRLMGYANVFNQYGRWMFYSGSMAAFSYEERTTRFEELVKTTLQRLTLSETPSIYFHYSSRFSQDDRAAILRAAQSVRPKGTYYFVWINTHHNIRLYDFRPETDGSLSRGSYVVTSRGRLYLSTTGYNPFRKTLGTPHMLELNVDVHRPHGAPVAPVDMKGIAMQVLSLTKLNWASTDSLCAEPITIKYAGDIAYLTAAFLRLEATFRLHPVLEQTPWFI